MKKIAILTCLKSGSSVCTGMSCFNAFYNRTGFFQSYDEDVRLETFFTCNGCNKNVESDEGLKEKMDRIISSGIDTIHIGVCTISKEGVICPTIQYMIDIFKKSGINTVIGTHSHSRILNNNEQ